MLLGLAGACKGLRENTTGCGGNEIDCEGTPMAI